MCQQKKETVSPLLCECPKLAQKVYKQRHDGVAKALHWDLCKQCDTFDKWYKHAPDSVEENENYKLLLDFPIQTDRKPQAAQSWCVSSKVDTKTYTVKARIPTN